MGFSVCLTPFFRLICWAVSFLLPWNHTVGPENFHPRSLASPSKITYQTFKVPVSSLEEAPQSGKVPLLSLLLMAVAGIDIANLDFDLTTGEKLGIAMAFGAGLWSLGTGRVQRDSGIQRRLTSGELDQILTGPEGKKTKLDQRLNRDGESSLAHPPSLSQKVEPNERQAEVKATLWLRPIWEQELDGIWQRKSSMPLQVRMALTSHLIDRLLQALCQIARQRFGEKADGISLVAHGSYAREEYVPGSDFDAKFLLEDPEEQAPVRTFLINVTQDVFDKVIEEFPPPEGIDWESPEKDEHELANSALESRFVAGNEQIWNQWRSQILSDLGNHWQGYVRAARTRWNERYNEQGRLDGLHVKEPDLKKGLGGLRDMQAVWRAVLAIAAGEGMEPRKLTRLSPLSEETVWQGWRGNPVMDPETLDQAQEAYLFLLRIRSLLRQMRPEKPTQLAVSQYAEVALRLGYPGQSEERTEAFLKDLREAQEVLFHFVYKALRRVSDQLDPPRVIFDEGGEGPGGGIEEAKRSGILFTFEKGWYHVPSDHAEKVLARRGEKPGTAAISGGIFDLLRYLASHHPMVTTGHLLDEIEESASFISRFGWRRLSFQFGRYLGVSEGSLAYGVERLRFLRISKQAGDFLDRLLPGFAQLTHRRHLDPPHRFTLDVHTLRDFNLGEALLFNHPEIAGQLNKEAILLQSGLSPALSYIKEKKLMRALRLVLLLHEFKTESWIKTSYRVNLALLSLGILPFGREARLVNWVIQNQGSLLDRIRRGLTPVEMAEYLSQELHGDPALFSLLIAFTLIDQAVLQPEHLPQRLRDFRAVLSLRPKELEDSRIVEQRIREGQKRLHRTESSGLLAFEISNDLIWVSVPSGKRINPDEIEELTIFTKIEKDHPGILAAFSLALAASGLDIERHVVDRIGSDPNMLIFDRFVVRAKWNLDRSWSELGKELETSIERLMNGKESAGQLLKRLNPVDKISKSDRIRLKLAQGQFSRSEMDIPPKISIKPLQVRGKKMSWLRVQMGDSLGLLYVLSDVLAARGINIERSTGDSEGDDPAIGSRVEKNFYLTKDGRPLDQFVSKELKDTLHHLLDPTPIERQNYPFLEPWMWQVPEQAPEEFLPQSNRDRRPGNPHSKKIPRPDSEEAAGWIEKTPAGWVRFYDSSGRLRREEHPGDHQFHIYYYRAEEAESYDQFPMGREIPFAYGRFDLGTDRLVDILLRYQKVVDERKRFLRTNGIDAESLKRKLADLIQEGKYRTVELLIAHLETVVNEYQNALETGKFQSFAEFVEEIAGKGLQRGISTHLMDIYLDQYQGWMRGNTQERPKFTLYRNQMNGMYAEIAKSRVGGEPLFLSFDIERLPVMEILPASIQIEVQPRENIPVSLNALTPESKREAVLRLGINPVNYGYLDNEWHSAKRESERELMGAL